MEQALSTLISGLPEVPAEKVDLRRMLNLYESNKLDAEENTEANW